MRLLWRIVLAVLVFSVLPVAVIFAVGWLTR